jgi:hypothetical protein
MITELLFGASFVVNIFLALYVRWLIVGLKEQSSQIEENNDVVIRFVEHVKSVHELEMFYGDENLQKLITHGKEVVSYFENLDFLIDEEIEEDLDENS